jgi:hypothetical protein
MVTVSGLPRLGEIQMRLALLFSLAFLFVGCTDDLATMQDDAFAQPESTGAVHVPLVATAADGTTYRIKGATFEVSGSAMVTLSERDAGDKAEELVASLPAGGYSMYLRPGWQIIEIKTDGTVSNITSTLSSRNPMVFDLLQVSDANVKLAFHSEGRELTFGSATPVRVTTAALEAN